MKSPDFALISRIEKGKNLLDKMRMNGKRESDLIFYIEEAIQARQAHMDYLERVYQGRDVISDKQEKYQAELKARILELRKVVESAEASRVQQTIKGKAADHNSKLALVPIEKKKKAEEAKRAKFASS